MRKKRFLFVSLSLGFILISYFTFGSQNEIPTVNSLDKAVKSLREDTDILWTALAAFLVFFMQAGFAMVEAGFTRAKNAANIIMKNLMDFCTGSLAFWLIGASLMFGSHDMFGWFAGNPDLALEDWLTGSDKNKFVYLIFQTVFAATAATIVSGAMAERTKFSAYLIYSVVITAFVYPIFGSWAWNSAWGIGKGGWLETLSIGNSKGFIDFAGSTVVHSIGGWTALAGTIILGPRRGRYSSSGTVRPIPGHSLTLAGLGVFILWFGWFGFNAGSTIKIINGDFAKIAVTTNLSAAAGAIGSLLTGWVILRKPDVGITLNGALAGLVAITAGCADSTPMVAVIIGFTAGIIVILSVFLLDKLKIDDPVGAISVHGTAGAWGTILIGLLATDKGGWNQFIIQLVGAGSAFIFAVTTGFALFYILKKTIGLRVNEHEESQGLDLTEHGAEAYSDFRISQR